MVGSVGELVRMLGQGREQHASADKGNCRRGGGRCLLLPAVRQPCLLSRSWVLPWASTLGGSSSKPKASLSLAVLTGHPAESATLSSLSLPDTLPAGRDTYTQDTKKLLSFLFSRGPRHPISSVMLRSTETDNSGTPRASTCDVVSSVPWQEDGRQESWTASCTGSVTPHPGSPCTEVF